MRHLVAITLIGSLLASGGSALGQEAGARGASVRHMDRAERHLLAAIDAIRRSPPGLGHDRAMQEARQALFRTQEARAGAIAAFGLAGPDEDNPRPEARAAIRAVLQAQDLAGRGDHARIRYAIERAEHALSMAGLEPLAREVVGTWLDEARDALRRGQSLAVRQALEQAEWALRDNTRMPPGHRVELGG